MNDGSFGLQRRNQVFDVLRSCHRRLLLQAVDNKMEWFRLLLTSKKTSSEEICFQSVRSILASVLRQRRSCRFWSCAGHLPQGFLDLSEFGLTIQSRPVSPQRLLLGPLRHLFETPLMRPEGLKSSAYLSVSGCTTSCVVCTCPCTAYSCCSPGTEVVVGMHAVAISRSVCTMLALVVSMS